MPTKREICMKRPTLGVLGIGVAMTGALIGPAAAPAAVPAGAYQPKITVVARGLANPRGVTLVSGAGAFRAVGAPLHPGFAPAIILVAEAGKGGSGPCATNDEGKQCF